MYSVNDIAGIIFLIVAVVIVVRVVVIGHWEYKKAKHKKDI